MIETNNTKGLGVAEILTLIFITLKLTGFIKWSWFWVLSPIWIAVGLIIVVIFSALGIGYITEKFSIKQGASL